MEDAVQVFPALLFVREYGDCFSVQGKAGISGAILGADGWASADAAAGNLGCDRTVYCDAENPFERGIWDSSAEPDICRRINNRVSGVRLFLRGPDALGAVRQVRRVSGKLAEEGKGGCFGDFHFCELTSEGLWAVEDDYVVRFCSADELGIAITLCGIEVRLFAEALDEDFYLFVQIFGAKFVAYFFLDGKQLDISAFLYFKRDIIG